MNNHLLPLSPISIQRTPNIYSFRERLTHEKYYRQNIMLFDKNGILIDSGFVQINDYTNNCNMVKVLDKNKTYLHACQQWQYSGTQYSQTEFYDIYDLHTGNVIATIHRNYAKSLNIKYILKNIDNDATLFIDDLQHDHLSNQILHAINNIHQQNRHRNNNNSDSRYQQEQHDDNDNDEPHVCDCRLFDFIDINHSLQYLHIDKQQHKQLLSNLTCICKPTINTLPPIDQPQLLQIKQHALDTVLLKLKILHNYTH
jgi:hypothetical protein